MRSSYFLMLSALVAAINISPVRAQSAAPAGHAVMVPGLWEITVQTRSPIIAAPISHTVCIDKLHVTKPDPPKSRAKDDCQVTPDAGASNETAYTVHCVKKNLTSTSRFTYSGDHFNGSITIKNADGEFQQVYTAVRISDCDDDLGDPAAPPSAKP
jgi:hypothetical protein